MYLSKIELEALINEGIKIIDVSNVYLANVKIEKGTIIHPNTTIINSTIGKNNTIYENSRIVNTIIGDNNTIISSHISDSKIASNTSIGPMAHIRMNSTIEDDCRIGNFVEFKNTHFKKAAKCAHLSYLGDCICGERVNIGCGVVTVNYDGKVKSQTIIENDAFIGSNVNLIAPIKIGSFALVAAGSTISKDVAAGDMHIERSQLFIKENYGIKYLNKEKKC